MTLLPRAAGVTERRPAEPTDNRGVLGVWFPPRSWRPRSEEWQRLPPTSPSSAATCCRPSPPPASGSTAGRNRGSSAAPSTAPSGTITPTGAPGSRAACPFRPTSTCGRRMCAGAAGKSWTPRAGRARNAGRPCKAATPRRCATWFSCVSRSANTRKAAGSPWRRPTTAWPTPTPVSRRCATAWTASACPWPRLSRSRAPAPPAWPRSSRRRPPLRSPSWTRCRPGRERDFRLRAAGEEDRRKGEFPLSDPQLSDPQRPGAACWRSCSIRGASSGCSPPAAPCSSSACSSGWRLRTSSTIRCSWPGSWAPAPAPCSWADGRSSVLPPTRSPDAPSPCSPAW